MRLVCLRAQWGGDAAAVTTSVEGRCGRSGRVGSGWLGDVAALLSQETMQRSGHGACVKTTGWGSHRLQVSVGDRDSIKGGKEDSRTLEDQLSYRGIQGGKVRPLPESQKQRRGGVSYNTENLFLPLPAPSPPS